MSNRIFIAFSIVLTVLAFAVVTSGHDENVEPGPTQFDHVMPIINVSDLKASIAYYTTVLGFTHDWSDPEEGPATFASVSNGHVQVFLSQGGQGEGTSWNYFTVVDVDGLHEQYIERGAEIMEAPEDKRWGMREMVVRDPDGNVMRIGTGIGEEAEHEHEE